MSQQPSSPSNQQSSDSNSSKVTEAECNVLDSGDFVDLFKVKQTIINIKCALEAMRNSVGNLPERAKFMLMTLEERQEYNMSSHFQIADFLRVLDPQSTDNFQTFNEICANTGLLMHNDYLIGNSLEIFQLCDSRELAQRALVIGNKLGNKLDNYIHSYIVIVIYYYLNQNAITQITTLPRMQTPTPIHLQTTADFPKNIKGSISESKSGCLWLIFNFIFGFPFQLQIPFLKIFFKCQLIFNFCYFNEYNNQNSMIYDRLLSFLIYICSQNTLESIIFNQLNIKLFQLQTPNTVHLQTLLFINIDGVCK
ncbi:Hypothetical_protein [Hexamita inflata]|uniref:Hypothetical_protein n=1 Tax=Hexamita inflata TaxID=28002 RepID=A0ABP1J4T6_9EUKA